MAFLSQEDKKVLAPGIKAVCKKYGVKASIGIRHHCVLVVNIRSGKLDILGNYCNEENEPCERTNLTVRGFTSKYGIKASIGIRHHSVLVVKIRSGKLDILGNYTSVNHNWIDECFSGEVRDFLNELTKAMNGTGTAKENFDKSDMMTDYCHVGWFLDINVWDTTTIT